MTSAPSPSPTFRQIQAQVRAVRSKRGLEGSTVFGIQSAGRWSGKALRRDGEETYQIVQCDSPLALRLALQEPLPAGAYKVLVTGLAQEDLSADILVRITKRRLLPIRSWEIVKDLFQATRVDPRLARHDWLADMLLELAPAGGFPAVQAGVLDAETVWAILLRRRLGLETASPDLIDILDWSLDSERAAGFREAPEAFRRAAREWLRGSAGPAAEVALGALEAGDAPSLAALGIALGVVFHPEAKGALAKAAGKIEERYLGGKPLAPEVADRWAPAATEAVYRGAAPKTRRAVLERADEILVSLQAEPYAWLSDASALGFRQRLVRFGGGLLRVLEGPGPEALAELRKLRESVLSHREAAEAPERTIDRVEMALRLARWLSSRVGREAPAWRSLEEAARDYAGEGGFVDWARHVLSTSEPVRELSEAYGKLRARVTQLRERQNEAFGLLLRDWTAAGSRSTELVPVEEVLDQVVAPLAERVPVLVLCLDGLTFAIARELLEDLLREEWVEVRQEGAPAVRPMLAALPTTTEVCRTSLFCGRLVQGTAADETAGFAEHPRLAPRAKSGSRPRLFHKTGLLPKAETDIDPEVRDAIASPRLRVVGTVVNAVDDHLHGSDQLDVRWTREAVKPLATLLYEARVSGRAVVVVGDHGHVIEYESEARGGEAAQRWRADDGRPGAGEVAVAGPRVVVPSSGRLIAPWSEKLRYGSKQSGYHGGASPQEAVVPLVVLKAGDLEVTGWAEAPAFEPEWWREPAAERAPWSAVAPELPRRKAAPAGTGQREFEFIEPPAAARPAAGGAGAEPAGWIDGLLGSKVFAQQKKLGGRGAPSDSQLRKLLEVFAEHGRKVLSSALAQKLGVPAFRMPGLIAAFQRLLNVEGYPVLIRDDASDTVELSQELLVRQFGLE